MGFAFQWQAPPSYCQGFFRLMPASEGQPPQWAWFPSVRPGAASTDGAAHPPLIPYPFPFTGTAPPAAFPVQQPAPA
jgi:hypothetical protein